MYFNTTSTSSAMPAPSAAASGGGRAPTPAFASPAALLPPVMRNRAPRCGGLGPPDYAGMRERRAQSGMTVRALQRQHGVVPDRTRVPDRPADDAWAVLASSLPTIGRRMLQTLTDAWTAEVGPSGCAAAPVRHPLPTPDSFRNKFSPDFEIWMTPAARHATDMKGMIILLGENHYDPDIQALIARVMFECRPARGDRFFIEGGVEQVCKERGEEYGLRFDDCRLLEKNSAVYDAANRKLERALQALESCVTYLYEHVPSSRGELRARNFLMLTQFIDRFNDQLPRAAIPRFNALVDIANVAIDEMKEATVQGGAARDRQMATVLRADRVPNALNFAVVGSGHLPGLREQLHDLPCVLMQPKRMVTAGEAKSLEEAFRTEL